MSDSFYDAERALRHLAAMGAPAFDKGPRDAVIATGEWTEIEVSEPSLVVEKDRPKRPMRSPVYLLINQRLDDGGG